MTRHLLSLPIILIFSFNIFSLLLISTSASTPQGNFISDLYTLDMTSFADLSSEWSILSPQASANGNKTYLCGTNPILGGPGILQSGSVLVRTYNELPSHNTVMYIINVYLIDSWTSSDYFTYTFDGINFQTYYPHDNSADFHVNYCGDDHTADLTSYYVLGTYLHSDPQLEIRIQVSLGTGSFGIRDINIMLQNTTLTQSNSYMSTQTGSTLPGGCANQYYKDSTACRPCDRACTICTGPAETDCFGCQTGFSYNGTLCYACPTNCDQCSGPASNQCIACTTGYILQPNGTCLNSPCILPQVLTSFGPYKFCSFMCSSPQLVLNDTQGSLLCVQSCPSNYQSDPLGQICLPSTSSSNSANNTAARTALPTLTPNNTTPLAANSNKDASQTLAKTLTTTSLIATIAATTSSLINFSSPAAMLMSTLLCIIQYIKYMSIDYPPRLQEMLNLETFSGVIAAILPPVNTDFADRFTDLSLPDNFEQYQLNSNFLINYWSSLASLALAISALVLVYLIQLLSAKYKRLHLLNGKTKEALKWNFLLTLFTCCYGDIAFYSSFQFRTSPSMGSSSSLSCLSLLICSILNFIMILVFIKIITVIKHLRKMRRATVSGSSQSQSTESTSSLQLSHSSSTSTTTNLSEYKSLYEDFRSESWLQQAFVPISVLRIYLFNTTIAYLFGYPVTQAVIITTLSILMLLYLIIMRPWKTLANQVQCIAQEIVILVVNSCVLGLACMDAAESEDQGKRDLLGDIVIWNNVAFGALALLFTFYQNVINIVPMVSRIRAWFLSKRTPLQNVVSLKQIRAGGQDESLSQNSLYTFGRSKAGLNESSSALKISGDANSILYERSYGGDGVKEDNMVREKNGASQQGSNTQYGDLNISNMEVDHNQNPYTNSKTYWRNEFEPKAKRRQKG